MIKKIRGVISKVFIALLVVASVVSVTDNITFLNREVFAQTPDEVMNNNPNGDGLSVSSSTNDYAGATRIETNTASGDDDVMQDYINRFRDAIKNKMYTYGRGGTDSVEGTFVSKFGPLGNADKDNITRQMAEFYRWTFDSGANVSSHGLSFYTDALVRFVVRGLGGFILVLLSLLGAFLSWVGQAIYGSLETLNFFRWISAGKLVTPLFEAKLGDADPEDAIALLGQINQAIRLVQGVMILIMLLISIIIGIITMRVRTIAKGFTRFFAHMFLLMVGIGIIASMVSGFATFMRSEGDDLGISSDIRGLILDYRGLITKGYIPVDDEKTKEAVASVDRELQALSKKFKESGESTKSDAYLAQAKAIISNANLADKIDDQDIMDALLNNKKLRLPSKPDFSNGRILTPDQIRGLNAYADSRSESEDVADVLGIAASSFTKDVFENGISSPTDLLSKLESHLQDAQNNSQYNRFINFTKTRDYQLIMGWMSMETFDEKLMDSIYGAQSWVPILSAFKPSDTTLQSGRINDPMNPITIPALERVYTKSYSMPGRVFSFLIFLTLVLKITIVAYIYVRGYAMILRSFFTMAVNSTIDLLKVFAYSGWQAIVMLFSTVFVMMVEVLGIRIMMGVFASIVRAPGKLLSGLSQLTGVFVPGSVGLSNNRFAGGISPIGAGGSSPGHIVAIAAFTLFMGYIIFKFLMPWLDRRFVPMLSDMMLEFRNRISGHNQYITNTSITETTTSESSSTFHYGQVMSRAKTNNRDFDADGDGNRISGLRDVNSKSATQGMSAISAAAMGGLRSIGGRSQANGSKARGANKGAGGSLAMELDNVNMTSDSANVTLGSEGVSQTSVSGTQSVAQSKTQSATTSQTTTRTSTQSVASNGVVDGLVQSSASSPTSANNEKAYEVKTNGSSVSKTTSKTTSKSASITATSSGTMAEGATELQGSSSGQSATGFTGVKPSAGSVLADASVQEMSVGASMSETTTKSKTTTRSSAQSVVKPSNASGSVVGTGPKVVADKVVGAIGGLMEGDLSIAGSDTSSVKDVTSTQSVQVRNNVNRRVTGVQGSVTTQTVGNDKPNTSGVNVPQGTNTFEDVTTQSTHTVRNRQNQTTSIVTETRQNVSQTNNVSLNKQYNEVVSQQDNVISPEVKVAPKRRKLDVTNYGKPTPSSSAKSFGKK